MKDGKIIEMKLLFLLLFLSCTVSAGNIKQERITKPVSYLYDVWRNGIIVDRICLIRNSFEEHQSFYYGEFREYFYELTWEVCE